MTAIKSTALAPTKGKTLNKLTTSQTARVLTDIAIKTAQAKAVSTALEKKHVKAETRSEVEAEVFEDLGYKSDGKREKMKVVQEEQGEEKVDRLDSNAYWAPYVSMLQYSAKPMTTS